MGGPNELHPVHLWHLYVSENEIELLLSQPVQSLMRSGNAGHLMSLSSQSVTRQL